MKPALKKLNEQVIVITGASSGIGLATAERAAKGGARVVLAARSISTLDKISERLQEFGSEVLAVECDVAVRADIDRLASEAIGRFGGFDTWVNNAGQGLYGRLDEVLEEDSRKLFDINFWGTVNGSLAALAHLRNSGGAIINVGSEVSDAYAPLLGMYVASKHAVKGFTDTLRVEIEEVDNAPVSITLIQPTAVDTPFAQHARNYQSQEAKLPDSRVEPGDVADAILKCAVTPTRQLKVGFKATLNSMLATLVPGMADSMTAKLASQQHYDRPAENPAGTLNQSGEEAGSAGAMHEVKSH